MQPFIDTGIHWVSHAWTWMSTWPDTLVGVVIGSVFTLTGVVLTNRTNLKNLRLHLDHDREQKAKERALSMRRDVYLSVAEALAAAMNTVIRYGDLSLDQATLMADYRAKSDQIAKVHVIATEATALRFVAFMRELGAVFVKLSIQRAPLLTTRARMQSLLEQMHRHNAARDHYLEIMKQFNVDGTMDDRRMGVLDKGFKFEQDGALKSASDHDTLLEELRPQHLAFAELCQLENARLSKMLLPVIESVRSELEQPIDVALYAKVFDGAPVATRQDLEALFGVNSDEGRT